MTSRSDPKSTIEVLDPVGNVSYDTEELAPRPSKLDGAKVALVTRRGEGGGTVGKLLEAAADSLAERVGVVGTVNVAPTPKREMAEPITGFTSSFEGRLAQVKEMAVGALVGVGV
ncbi:MAG: hypothetical protein HY680_02865 [Chloroflexi bacterium]|nr:hypothetical protein [Chloroflexota bacterium]